MQKIGLTKYLPRIEKLGKMKFNGLLNDHKQAKILAEQALKTKREITITVGPTNVHDILDSIK